MKTVLRAFAAISVLATAVAVAADAPKPDFSGVWTNYRPVGAPAGPGGRADPGAFPRDPPFTAEAKAKIAEYRELVTPLGLTPGGACVGYGMPSSMLSSGGYPMEWIQRPEQVTVIYEAHSEIRRIYIGGPPNEKDMIPGRDGNSYAHWEGNTLVVTTIGLKEAVDQASAHSDKAKIVERYTIGKDDAGRKVLTAEMTMTDPVFYTKPVTATKRWLAVENGRLLPYDCTEPQWEDQLDKLRQEKAAKAKDSDK
jgi:hypothetical protein